MAHRITLLTRAGCRLSEHAKAVLDRVGRDVPLDVEEISLDSERGHTLGAWVPFTPGVLLDGRPFGFGRLPERLLRGALQTAGSPPAPVPRAGHGPPQETVESADPPKPGRAGRSRRPRADGPGDQAR